MCDFGLQMNESKILGMTITPIFSCTLATKWKQRLRVNVKLFRGQGKIRMISAVYIDQPGNKVVVWVGVMLQLPQCFISP